MLPVEELIKGIIHHGDKNLIIKVSQEKGRKVFAGQPISKGQFIMECSSLALCLICCNLIEPALYAWMALCLAFIYLSLTICNMKY